MDRETLLNWLAVAERHVEEGTRQLLQQRKLLSRLQAQGHSKSATAGMARELLDTMERLQAHHIAHVTIYWWPSKADGEPFAARRACPFVGLEPIAFRPVSEMGVSG